MSSAIQNVFRERDPRLLRSVNDGSRHWRSSGERQSAKRKNGPERNRGGRAGGDDDDDYVLNASAPPGSQSSGVSQFRLTARRLREILIPILETQTDAV